MWNLVSIIAASLSVLFVFTVIVFVHEFGHFIVARRCGVHVVVFSFGMGPELIGWNDKRGTRWRISAFPLGGYVRFLGDADAASSPDFETITNLSTEEQKKTLLGVNVWRRIAIIFAGPLASVLYGFFVFTFFFYFYVTTITGTPRIVDFDSKNPVAVNAGFQIGDELLQVDGKPILSAMDILQAVQFSPGKELQFLIRRSGKEEIIKVSPASFISDTAFGKQRVTQIGIKFEYVEETIVKKQYGFLESINAGAAQCWSVVSSNLRAVHLMIKGDIPVDNVSGPIRGAEAIGRIGVALDFKLLVYFSAILSVWIGVVNLFPIPMLDGGHIFMFLIEAVRGKPLNEKFQEFVLYLGFSIIILLTFLVLGMDIMFKVIHW